jgi:hypothetical protein
MGCRVGPMIQVAQFGPDGGKELIFPKIHAPKARR